MGSTGFCSREETGKRIIDGKWADKAFVRWQEHLGTTGYDLKGLVRQHYTRLGLLKVKVETWGSEIIIAFIIFILISTLLFRFVRPGEMLTT